MSTNFAKLDLLDLAPDQGFVIHTSGGIVSAAGDVNGDGLDDLFSSGYYWTKYGNEGRVDIVYGTIEPRSEISFSTVTPPDDATIMGHFLFSGLNAAGIGDINGDGFDDFMIGGSTLNRAGGFFNGKVFFLYGSETTTPFGSVPPDSERGL